MWGFFFVAPRAVSNAVEFYRLTIRCVGCSTTFLIFGRQPPGTTSPAPLGSSKPAAAATYRRKHVLTRCLPETRFSKATAPTDDH